MKKKSIIISFTLLLITFIKLDAQNVEVVISGIRNDKGQIVIGVFKDNESFQVEKPFINKQYPKSGISNGEMTVKFDLDKGDWGLSLLDDENGDGKMEYNFIGMPREGFGFSNYYLTGLTKPKFDAFRFTIADGQTLKVSIRVRYM